MFIFQAAEAAADLLVQLLALEVMAVVKMEHKVQLQHLALQTLVAQAAAAQAAEVPAAQATLKELAAQAAQEL
jgi:hypothetical protein